MADNDIAALRVCPFCGSAGNMDEDPGEWGHEPATAFVRCSRCNTCGPTFDEDEGGKRNYRAEAAAAWNLRAPDPTLLAELETLREKVAQGERDAERLDFLMDECAVVKTDGYGFWRVVYEWLPEGTEGPWADSKREAIDAALASRAGKGSP